MKLKTLIEKGSVDDDLLREMMADVANRMMDIEVEGLTGAAHGERSASRVNHRNGYRERSWETRAGTVDLEIPKLRKGSCFPVFLEPRRASEKAFTAVIQKAGACPGLDPGCTASRRDRSMISSKPWG